MANFEVFRSKGARANGSTDTLTIDKRGQLAIGRDAYLQLGEPKAVELLYDRETTTIGIRPVDPSSGTAYAVRGGDKISYTVSGTAFLRHYGIPFGDTAIRRRAEMVNGILCVDLQSPGMEVTSNRAKRS